jgi:anaerobic selenocysteine-containing dehydrogenase
VAVPGKARMVEALGSLELLVTIDPFLSETAQLAHYVIAPVGHLERPDTTRSYEGLMDQPFAQYTPAVLEPPPGVIDDWELFVRLAGAMGRTLQVAGREYAPGAPTPATDEVLASFAGRGRAALDEVKRHPHGVVFDELEPVRATAPRADASATFDVAPSDVVAELALVAARLSRPEPTDDRLLLVVRRTKEVVNSTGTQLGRLVREPRNPCHLHPDDLARLGLAPGAAVTVTSEHGSIRTVAAADATLRVGVASMTHGFGGPGDADPPGHGASTNRLLSGARDLQPISGMPLMTAVPVTVTATP